MNLAQVSIALSVAFVWIFRYHNVIAEFKSFGLSDLTRNFVGVSKIALSTLLITGIWFPSLVFVSSILMGFFMVSAHLCIVFQLCANTTSPLGKYTIYHITTWQKEPKLCYG